MAIDGKTNYDIEPFTLDREALKDPDYKPAFIMGARENVQNSRPDKSNAARL